MRWKDFDFTYLLVILIYNLFDCLLMECLVCNYICEEHFFTYATCWTHVLIRCILYKYFVTCEIFVISYVFFNHRKDRIVN
jgi:hypothetical protein